MRKIYKRGKDAANSWNQTDIMGQVATRASEFANLADASNAEQWQVNAAVHFNSWDNLGRDDFAPVVEALRNLLDGFTCSDCSEYLRVSPDRETAESLRCECGEVDINLCKKDS